MDGHVGDGWVSGGMAASMGGWAGGGWEVSVDGGWVGTWRDVWIDT